MKDKKHHNNKSGNNKDSYQRATHEPWLLASSLPEESNSTPQKVTALYKTRMQIEEGFRDLNSSQYGLSFEQAQSKQIERTQVLLLLAMLASLVAYITGLAAENENLHYQFLANTIRHRRVLSYFFLGCRIVAKKIKIPKIAWLKAVDEVKTHVF